MSSTKPDPLTIPPELEAEMTPAVRAFVGLLLDRIAKLEARVEELERGQKTPRNSSLPPSTQHPHARPQPPKRKSKKKRGGQPGHEKHERPLIPTDECDDVHPLRPTECRRCGAKLSGSDPEPLRHQVWELPEIKPDVTEYQRHRLTCPGCGETTCAELPLGVPRGQLNIDETETKEENGKAWLWTFLRHEGVKPTNNAGERSLRHAVIWRKLSFGTQSASGSRFVETMLTVIETCRQQRLMPSAAPQELGKPCQIGPIADLINLAQFALAHTRGWAANSLNTRIRLKAELDRAKQELALLREEIRIKDARMARIPPHRRPFYPPIERLAILELQAARAWSSVIRPTVSTVLECGTAGSNNVE